MWLVFALVCLVIAVNLPNAEIRDVPFSQLTLHMLADHLLVLAAYGGVLFCGYRSLQEDRVWPWRWKRLYFFTLLVRGGLLAILACAILLLGPYLQKGAEIIRWLVWVGFAIASLGILLSDELSFEERLIRKILHGTKVEESPAFVSEGSDAFRNYTSITAWARREATEKYVRDYVVKNAMRPPAGEIRLWTKDSGPFRVEIH